MSNSFEISQIESGPLNVSGALDIYAADGLRQALITALEGSAEPALDLSGVTSCSLVALQLICSAQKSAEQANKKLSICAASEPVFASCVSAGFSPDQLNLPTREI